MFVLGEENEQRQPPAFVELDELWTDGTLENPPEWREVARFVIFYAYFLCVILISLMSLKILCAPSQALCKFKH